MFIPGLLNTCDKKKKTDSDVPPIFQCIFCFLTVTETFQLAIPFAWKVSMYIALCRLSASNWPRGFPVKSDWLTFIV